MKPIKLQTAVPLESSPFSIGYDDQVLLIGSCFTENMGWRMGELGFSVNINPFGIVYNPLSMVDTVRRCLEGEEIGEEVLVRHEGLWHSWLHHGSFSHRDKASCLALCNNSLREAAQFIKGCSTIVFTFGSAWYYSLVESGMVVANCHKLPSTLFKKNLATVEELLRYWVPLTEKLLDMGKRLIFTVSPVRHGAYGAHGNQLGKATLLLAINSITESIIQQHNSAKQQITYFPAYEIMMDELRDYRFYADDLLHPSDMAEEIIWQRFQQVYMSKETIELCDLKDKENRRAAHRPIHENN